MSRRDAPAAGDARAPLPPTAVGIVLIAVVAAFGGAASGAQPTGLPVADALWSGAVAALLVVAASRTRPWTWIWLCGVAAVASLGSPTAVICSLAALVIAVAAGTLHRAPKLLGPLVAGLGAQALLRLPPFATFGVPSVIAALACTPLLVTAYRESAPNVRRVVRWSAFAGLAFGLVAVVAFGVVALQTRTKIDTALARSRSGLDAVRKGDQGQATKALGEAEAAFRSAHDAFSSPLAVPVRVVPIASQQALALSRLSDLGADLAATGSTTATKANYRDLRAAKGTVDLAALAAMQQPVATAADALHRASQDIAEIRSSWLVPPIAGPLATLDGEVADEVREADLARDVLAVAPDMLGRSGPRRYVVLFTNPAESRFLGGFVGAFAELNVENGKVSFTTSTNEDQFADTLAAQQREVTISPDLAERYRRYDPARFLQNLTVSPDFPVDAQLVREVYPQVTGRPVDGVIVADPFALAGFLKLTGPVKVDGLTEPLTADNAVDYLLKGQYVAGGPNSERKERLGDGARATFDALTSRDLPGPSAMGAALGPALRGGHLQFTSFDDKASALLDRLGTIRRFDPQSGHDYVSMRTANANPNKLDTYLHRRLDYDVTYAPRSGEVKARATVTLTNAAPAGLPDYVAGNDRQQPPGSNTSYLSLYSPLQLREATENRAPFAIESQREFGGSVYSALVTVPVGETRTIVFDLTGTVPTGATYNLDVLSQPTINPDGARVIVHTADSEARIDRAQGLVVNGDTATIDEEITDNRRFSTSFVAR